jgi:hypothetical protein
VTRLKQITPVVIVLSLLWTMPAVAASAASSPIRRAATVTPPSVVRRKPRTFKLVEHSCESGCSDAYESPDGKQVTFVFACYTGTAAEARAEVERMSSEGTVIETARRIGKKKRSERTVMLHPAEDGKRAATIFWYRKGDVCFSYIEAESLELAREFERSRAAVEPLSSYTARTR